MKGGFMTTHLKCEHCNEMFEISNEIADAMTRWRNTSGEPITCGECAGTLEEIDTPDNDRLGAVLRKPSL